MLLGQKWPTSNLKILLHWAHRWVCVLFFFSFPFVVVSLLPPNPKYRHFRTISPHSSASYAHWVTTRLALGLAWVSFNRWNSWVRVLLSALYLGLYVNDGLVRNGNEIWEQPGQVSAAVKSHCIYRKAFPSDFKLETFLFGVINVPLKIYPLWGPLCRPNYGENGAVTSTQE